MLTAVAPMCMYESNGQTDYRQNVKPHSVVQAHDPIACCRLSSVGLRMRIAYGKVWTHWLPSCRDGFRHTELHELQRQRKTHWPHGVTVSTLDSESSDRGSNPREAFC